jgi:uncharacterized membrane protein
MDAGLAQLIVATALFVGGHVALSSTPLRAVLVGAVGERGFAGLFSGLMIALFAWLLVSYGNTPYAPVWEPPAWTRWVPIVVMPFALLLLVAGLSQANPTAAMRSAPGADSARQAPGILAVTRHPMLWSFALWALAHLAANGDLASIILMGAMAVLALGGTLLIDRKKAKAWGPAWPGFAAVTSNLPFAAMLAGRTWLSLAELGWWRIALALVLYALLMHFHAAIIGVPVLA